MIHLNVPRSGSTVERYDFDFAASAGALGWAGMDEGHGIARLWRWPFRLLRLLDTRPFAFFTKTLTLAPRVGNLRLFSPWRAVRPLWGGSFVNSVGMTNPGINAWIDKYGPVVEKRRKSGISTFVSVAASNTRDLAKIVRYLNANLSLTIYGIELDMSCANLGNPLLTGHELANHSWAMLAEALMETRLPVGLKFGATQNFVEALERCDGIAAWYHLINAVPWANVFDSKASPLAPYGYQGAVSGPAIRSFSEFALQDALARRPSEQGRTPIISGGGISTEEDVWYRFNQGADACAFGSLFLSRPWRPLQILHSYRNNRLGPVLSPRKKPSSQCE